jgi:hypothetical protein
MNELVRAARLALHAPSVFNTQPWLWLVGAGTLELYADRDRHLGLVDPDDRPITRSCGAALCPPGRYPHHPGWAAHPLDFNGTYSGSNPRPPSFTFNGATCST